MKGIKKIWLILSTMILVLGFVASSWAVTYDFEGIPLDYHYDHGHENLGTYYSGVTFGPLAIIDEADVDTTYIFSGYPPHSGTSVLVTDANKAYIDVIFNGAVSDVSLWYTLGLGTIYLEAYSDAAMTTLIGSVTGLENHGMNSFLSLGPLSGIQALKIHNCGNYFTIDDLTAAVPEPATFLLLGSGLIGVGLLRKRFKR